MSFKSKYTGRQIENYLDTHKWEYIYNSVGDIVYYSPNTNKTYSISPSQWNNDLGIPMGVIVIPSGVNNSNAKICSLYSTFNRFGWSNYCINFSNSSLQDNKYIVPSDVFESVKSDDDLCYYSRESMEGEVVINSPWFGRRKSKNFNFSQSNYLSSDEWWSLPDTIWENTLLNMWDDTGLYNNWVIPNAEDAAFLMSRLSIINNAIDTLNKCCGSEKYHLIGNNIIWFWHSMLSTDPAYTYAYAINVASGEIIRAYDVDSEFECRPFCEWSAAEEPIPYFSVQIQNSKNEIINLPVKQGCIWKDVVDKFALQKESTYEPGYGVKVVAIEFPEYEINDNGYWIQNWKDIYHGENLVGIDDVVEQNVIYTIK